MASWIRRIVSGQKKRFQDDGFDLDLAYISPRIIAMGLPAAAGKELLFRNPMPEIARFLRHYHRGHAKVFNLCSEHTYSQEKLSEGALQHYPYDDHQTPALVVVQQFCADAAAWLAAHPRNVVVVHCKAGKGRTGIMICCLLLYLHVNGPHLANLEPAAAAAAAAAAAGQPGSEEGDAARSDSSGSSLASADCSSGRGWHPWQSVEPVQVSRLASPAQDVLALYAERRTHDGNGVTIASQRRYVAYFWRVLASGPRPCGSLPARRTLQLRQLVISGLPPGVADSCVVAVEARPSGSTAPSATRVLVVPGPRALSSSSSMPGMCLAPCVTQPLVRDDGCRIAIASSATTGDTLTLTMPAASMGLSELSSKQQQQQQRRAAPGCCGACGGGGTCGCLGAGGRLSPAAVAPATAAEGGAAVDAAAAYGLAGEWVPAAGCTAAAASERDGGEAAGDQQQGCCVVEGDVRILVLRGGSRLFYTWLNTGLLPPGGCYSLTKAQLDKPAKGLPDHLQMTVRFVDLKPHADEDEEENGPGGTRPGQQQQQQGDEGMGTPRLLPPGASGWVGLGKRLLTTTSHKRPAVDGAGGAKRSSVSSGSRGGPAAASAPAAAPRAGGEAAGGGSASASKRAKLVLTGSSSSSALAGMGQQHQPAQRQPVQGSVSAPASPHSVGKLPVGKLARSSSWKWQHLPAITSISGSLWDWAGAAGSVAEEGEASAASDPGMLQPQSRLSWDWDWPSLAAPVASQPVLGGPAVGGAAGSPPALASAGSAPALLDACSGAGAAVPGVAALPAAADRVQWQQRKQQPGKSSSSSVSGSGRYRPIQQDLHTSGLSRSPAAIELPCLRRLPGTSATVNALLDPPAVTLAASPQQQQLQAAAASSVFGRGAGSSGSNGGARKPGASLWQLLLREPVGSGGGGGRAGLQPGSAASRAAARPGEGGDEEDDDDGGDTYPVADVLARTGGGCSRPRLLRADGPVASAGAAVASGSGGGPAVGSWDSLQGLLDALNWSTDTWRPAGATAAGGPGASSSWQQRQRRHTYSGPGGSHGGGTTSSCSSSPVARRQAMKKVHSAPNTPPGLASLSGDQQQEPQQEQQRPSVGWAAAAASGGSHSQQRTSRLLDLEGADESSSLAAHSSAGQLPCCVDCMFGLHASPCPVAPSAAAATASPAAAVALISAAAAGGGGGTVPLQSARSCPLQPAGSSCDADVRVTAIQCSPGGSGSGGKHGASRSTWLVGTSGGGAAGRRGEASEQLQALLAAAGDGGDDAGGPAAPLGLRSSGEPDAVSLTQQWRQLEKAWQRSWCV